MSASAKKNLSEPQVPAPFDPGQPSPTASHTAGPWRWTDGTNDIDIATYKPPGYYNNPQLVGPDGRDIIGCDEYWTIGPCIGSHAEQVANARLIAAAPDLLEALKAAKKWFEIWRPETPTGTVPIWFEDACAALSKASPTEGK